MTFAVAAAAAPSGAGFTRASEGARAVMTVAVAAAAAPFGAGFTRASEGAHAAALQPPARQVASAQLRANLNHRAVAEALPHKRDVLGQQTHAAEAAVLPDRVRLDGSMDAVALEA